MYIDLLDSKNYVLYNLTLAQKLGIYPAIVLSKLIALKSSDNKLDIDFSEILNSTAIDLDNLQICIDLFIKLKILDNYKQIEDKSFTANFNEDLILAVISEDQPKVVTDLKSIVKAINKAKNGRMSQRQRKFMELKNKLQCPNEELLQAYRNWIDGVYENPKGFLSPSAIAIFQKTVDEFAKGDLDLALKIIEIATVGGYRDATWAINVFNKDYANSWKRERAKTKVNSIIAEPKVQLNSEVF